MEEGAEAKAWYPGTISNILKNQAYIGNMVQGKRRTSLYDNEARHATDENDWIVVENTHEAIVDKELFARVRAVMDKKVEESIFTSGRGKNLPIKKRISLQEFYSVEIVAEEFPLASRIWRRTECWSASIFIPADTIMISVGNSVAVPLWSRSL